MGNSSLSIDWLTIDSTPPVRSMKDNSDIGARGDNITNINTSIHQYINTSIHQYINTSIHQYINTSIHQYINTSIHQYINLYRLPKKLTQQLS
ncbi:hypothetical protein GZ449_003800 [Salmonella enterica]|nr:hypothetical protein [Salmonella enterica]